jgi:hypothetical protein
MFKQLHVHGWPLGLEYWNAKLLAEGQYVSRRSSGHPNLSRFSGIFLGYRVNAELEHRFQVLLHDSYAEISILQENFAPVHTSEL